MNKLFSLPGLAYRSFAKTELADKRCQRYKINKIKCYSSNCSNLAEKLKDKSVLQLALSSVTFFLTYFDVGRVVTHSFRFDFLTR